MTLIARRGPLAKRGLFSARLVVHGGSSILPSAASFETKQRIKDAIDIVDLVGSYLPLRHEGKIFKALCPWHDDTRPSLQVNPERQSFKCWVCQIGGDIFSFVMKMEGVEFPEALAMLADRANIPLEASRGDTRAPVDEKRLMFQAMAWASGQFHQCLLEAPEAAPARDYLAERSITAHSISRFQLGFAPNDWNWISNRARGTPYAPALLEKIGLVSRRQQGPGYYDRFKGRVLFPIFDAQARAVGVGGRVLPQLAAGDVAKYVNSPETPLFSKSSLLYGLHVARDAIRKSETVLVTEGYTDCIAAHQAGFENTVAVLGTALGAAHVQLLRRFADRIRVVLVLDGDEAGRRRAKEVLELFVAGKVDLRVLTLPDEQDPAEFLLAHGRDALESLVEQAPDALRHARQVTTAGIDLRGDVHRASLALEELVATIAKAPRLRADTLVEDRLREEKFLQRLAVDFGVPEEQVRELMTQYRRKAATRPGSARVIAPASVTTPVDPLERELLEIILHYPALMEQIVGVVQAGQFTTDDYRRVYFECSRLFELGILPSFERLLLEIDDSVVKNLLVELEEGGRRSSSSDVRLRLRDALAVIKCRTSDERIRGATQAMKTPELSEEEKLSTLLELQKHQELLQHEKNEAERARKGTSDPTEG
jgi:DNA primase